MILVFNFRRHESFLDGHISEMQRRKWEEEKRAAQLKRVQREEINREMVVRKRKYEKKEMDKEG